MELQRLEILNLSNCKLRNIPLEIVNLKRLKCIDLQYNNIKKIPTEIAELKLKLSYDQFV